MKYIKTYEQSSSESWIVNIDKYFEASLRKIGMGNNEAKRWLYNFTHSVAKPKTKSILVLDRNGSFSWNDNPLVGFRGEVELTPEEKEKYDIEKDANKYNL